MSNNVQQELSTTAYGELRSPEDTPVTQISSKYNLLNEVLTVVDSSSSGSNTINEDKFTCQTGTAADGLASILTLRQVGVRPGQGMIARFDVIFSTGLASSQQAAGLITSGNSYVFAFLNTTFGIAHTHGGVSEAQELTITTSAAGSEDATINIDGNPFTVPLTSGTVQHNALEISNSLQSQVANYNFTSNNDQVVAQSLLAGSQGAFSFSSATAIAAWVQDQVGLSPIIDFTPQANWNEDDRLSGSVTEILDPTKGNFYEIQVSSNFSAINFSIEDNDSGNLILVHKIKASNIKTTTNVTNPTFRIGWFVENLGSIINLTCSGSEASGFIEGKTKINNIPRSDSNNQLSVGTSLTNIMTFRNRIHFGGKVNRVEVYPKGVSVSSQANKSTFFVLLLNPIFSGDVDFFYIDKDNSVMEASIDSVGISGGTEIGALTISPDGNEILKFNEGVDQDIIILPGQIITIAAFVASGAGGDMQQSLTWQEDIL